MSLFLKIEVPRYGKNWTFSPTPFLSFVHIVFLMLNYFKKLLLLSNIAKTFELIHKQSCSSIFVDCPQKLNEGNNTNVQKKNVCKALTLKKVTKCFHVLEKEGPATVLCPAFVYTCTSIHYIVKEMQRSLTYIIMRISSCII